MAGVIGSSGGGYATVNPTQGNAMGEALQNVENSAFKYNAIKREEDQLEASRQQSARDARTKELKDNQAYADKHKISTTSISSVNKAVLDFSTDNKNLYNDAANIYKTSNNDDERRNALETMSNLESSFEVAKALPEMLNTSAKDLEEGVRQGKYNPNSSTNAAKTIEAMSKGDMKVVFKSNGIPTFITYKRDSQGNLSEIIDKEMTMEQLKQKLAPIMAFDSKTNDIDFGKTLGDRIETEQGNNIIKGYPNLKEAAEQNANSIITNKDKMYGVAADAGVTPKADLADYTPEEIATVKSYITKGLEDKYKPSVTTNDAKLNREQTARNQERTQRNSNRDYNYKVNNVEEEGKVRVSTKDGLLGEETTVSETMTRSEYEKKKAEEAKVAKSNKKEVSPSNNPFTDGINKAFKSGDKAKITEKPKEKVAPKAKSYSATQENAIKAALKKNPGYTRKEIIAALKL